MGKNYILSNKFMENGFLGVFSFRMDEDALNPFFLEEKLMARKIHFPNQVHSNRVLILEEEGDLEGDALISMNGDFVGVKTADCIPIIGCDKKLGITFAAHAGWRGIARGILKELMRKLKGLGSHENNLLFSLGPGICEDHYPVGEEVIKIFKKIYPPSVIRDNKLNLKKCLILELVGKHMIPEANIENINICTFEDTRFSSYRREKSSSRQISFVGKI